MSSATPTKSEELERIPRHDPKATPERVADSIVRYVEKALTEAYLSVTPPSPAAPVSAKLQALRLKRLPISRRNQTRKRMETHDKLLGDLFTPCLVVEPGGFFDGECHMPTPTSEKTPAHQPGSNVT